MQGMALGWHGEKFGIGQTWGGMGTVQSLGLHGKRVGWNGMGYASVCGGVLGCDGMGYWVEMGSRMGLWTMSGRTRLDRMNGMGFGVLMWFDGMARDGVRWDVVGCSDAGIGTEWG